MNRNCAIRMERGATMGPEGDLEVGLRLDLVKTATFAVLHFGVGFAVAYLLTGSVTISAGVALIEPAVNTVVFFFHEKAWRRFGSSLSCEPSPSERKSVVEGKSVSGRVDLGGCSIIQ